MRTNNIYRRQMLWSLIVATAILCTSCSKNQGDLIPENITENNSDVLVLTKALPTPAGKPITILAGFGVKSDSKTTISLGSSYADVLWCANDSWRAYYTNGSSVYYADFTTTQDRVRSAHFTASSTPTGDEFFCIYPQASRLAWYSGDLCYGANIPNVQTAVAGGVANGINVALAYTTSLSDEIHFKSIPAYIKFKLSGSVVSQITSVSLVTNDYVAGDFVFMNNAGEPVVTNLAFSGDESFSTITLNGSFTEGTDYLMAAIPRSDLDFYMVFSDGTGQTIVKRSSKKLNLTSSNMLDFGTIDLGDKFDDDDDCILYMAATEGTKPVTIAVIPDGFTETELSNYEVLAKNGIDALFNTEPFKTYKNYFNVYIMKVASNESGANITDGSGNITTAVDCYFESRWGTTSYSDMTANATKIFSYVSSICPDIVDGTHTINEVPILMIINDTRYGGICHSYSDGRAYCMAPYSYAGGALSWGYPGNESVSQEDDSEGYRTVTDAEKDEMGRNIGNWTNTLVHEYGGHAFSRLADEYWYDANKASTTTINTHTWPVPMGLNISGFYTVQPWYKLLDNKADLVVRDPNYSRIGNYQGAGVYMYGRWRSERISCMIDNRFYFSAWQRYLIVQRILTLSGDSALFDYDFWLANDVTTDPLRDIGGGSTIQVNGAQNGQKIHQVGPLPPPVLHND